MSLHVCESNFGEHEMKKPVEVVHQSENNSGIVNLYSGESAEIVTKTNSWLISWFKCHERLPQEDKEVIFYEKEIGKIIGTYKSEKVFCAGFFTKDIIFYPLSDITHWAYTPGNPED